MYTFPDLLKKIRYEAGLTQEDLAKKLGVSTVLVTMIETGQKEASKGFLEKLAEILGVHPSSVTPFLFIKNDLDIKKLSHAERALIAVGENLQEYLIKKRSKLLKL